MLLHTVQGATVTQNFGRSALQVEPEMWYVAEKAYWLPFAGASHSDDFHPGIDRAAPLGTPVLAMEAGTVVFSGWKDNISGIQVEVEIRPNTRYSVNHLNGAIVKVGQKVDKADTIGYVGRTGAATGFHTHEGLSIREPDSAGVYRTFLYNPSLFQKGGKYANDPRVQPEQRYVRVDGPGVVVWIAGTGMDDRSDIYCTARKETADKKAGLYRWGKRISSIGYKFTFVRWREVEEHGKMAMVTGFGRRLGIRKEDCHFV